jgi:hypothetical protein
MYAFSDEAKICSVDIPVIKITMKRIEGAKAWVEA